MLAEVPITIINTLTMDARHYGLIDLAPNAHKPPTRWIITAMKHATHVRRDHLADYDSEAQALEQFEKLATGGQWFQTGQNFRRTEEI